jgi:hypothetical protein
VENIVITWRELLLVVALILAVYIAEMLLLLRTGGSLFRRSLPRVGNRDLKAEAELHQEIRRLAERLEILEGQMGRMAAEEQVEPTPYNRAIQMARQGRNADRISESCGISRGEAELIVSVHGRHE